MTGPTDRDDLLRTMAAGMFPGCMPEFPCGEVGKCICLTTASLGLAALEAAGVRVVPVGVLEALRDIELDCEADSPPSHGAIKYTARMAFAAASPFAPPQQGDGT